MEKKITFKDLSGSLKTLVVIGWILVGIYVLFIIAGFTAGILESGW
jgi:hypothetical protein